MHIHISFISTWVSNPLHFSCQQKISPFPTPPRPHSLSYMYYPASPHLVYRDCRSLDITSSLGLRPGVSSHLDQIRSNLVGHPLCWYIYFSLMRVCPICSTHVRLVGGPTDFQPMSISFLAWNKAMENATLTNSSGISSSRTPSIQHMGSRGTFVWNTSLSVLITSLQYRWSFGHLHRRWIRSPSCWRQREHRGSAVLSILNSFFGV